MCRVLVDFFNFDKKDYLILTDIFLKWPEFIENKKLDFKLIVKKWRETFNRLWVPNNLVSDNEPQFRSEEFIQFCR